MAELQAAGDKCFYEGESHANVTCEACLGGPPRRMGTPLSELSGRPGHDGYEEFCRIAATWGHD